MKKLKFLFFFRSLFCIKIRGYLNLCLFTLLVSQSVSGNLVSLPIELSLNEKTTISHLSNLHIEKGLLEVEKLVAATAQSSSNSFHLFSHGKPGYLLIDNEWKNPIQIKHWLNNNYNINAHNTLNIYGCNFAKGLIGENAVKYLQNELNIFVADSVNITGTARDWDLEVGYTNSSIVVKEYHYNVQTCSTATFNWDDGNGNGQTFQCELQLTNYNLNAGGGLGVTLEIIDPFNRNADLDSHDAATHPYDPAGGCTGIEQFGNDCGTEESSITPAGSIGDPRDLDCTRDFTQTNGVYGLNYLTIWMYSQNSDEEVEYQFTFDSPTNVSNFRISDNDAVGFNSSNRGCEENGLVNSYQDEVRLFATDLCGDQVALNIISSSVQPSSQQIIDPLAQTSRSEYVPNLNSNITPNNLDGEIQVSSTKPVTTFSIFYSNGPDDQAWEENNAAQHTWWSAANGATSGVSDDHAIRLDGFDFCACPLLNIAVNAQMPVCKGAPVAYNVTSDFTATRLIVDGVDQPAKDSFTVDVAIETS